MSTRTQLTAGLRTLITLGITASILATGIPGAAAAPARPSVSNGGGYVAKADPLRSARMAVRVPTLSCVKGGPSATVTIGLFGSTHTGSNTSAWTASVVASCADGVSSYRAALGDTAGPNAMRVHHGDLVQLSVHRGPVWEITDVTSHRGMGVSGPVGPDEHPTLDRHLLLGAHLSGRLSHAVDVVVRAAKINRQPFAQTPHHRRLQTRGTAVVVRPGAIADGGTSFSITIG